MPNLIEIDWEMTEKPEEKNCCREKEKRTRIEPVGEPYREVCKAPEKETNKCPKTELTGEMFCYKKINTFMKKAKEEWIHDIVYDPKRSHGH